PPLPAARCPDDGGRVGAGREPVHSLILDEEGLCAARGLHSDEAASHGMRRTSRRTISEGRHKPADSAIRKARLQNARERPEIARLLLAISGVIATPNARRSRWVRVEQVGPDALASQARVRRADQN